MKVSELRTAREIHRADLRHLAYRVHWLLQWPGHAFTLMRLKRSSRD